MNPISKEYVLLFNAITDAQETLDRLRQALVEAQQQAEELYLGADDALPDNRQGKFSLVGGQKYGTIASMRRIRGKTGRRFAKADGVSVL